MEEKNVANAFYNYLGYGTTDENGVARLTRDSNGNPIEGYLGVAAGEIDIVTSTDNVIGDNSIISKTSSFIDAWMRDGGVTGDCNNEDWLIQSGGSRTVYSDGTVFSASIGTSLFAWINKHGTSHTTLDTIAEYSGDYCIELTVVEVNGEASCSIYEAYPSPKRVAVPLSVGKWRIEKVDNVVNAYKNGELYSVTSVNLTSPQRIGLTSYQGSVKVRNVYVYALSLKE